MRKIYAEIDWALLLMFVGLFVVVAGLENRVLTPPVLAVIGRLHPERVPVLSTMTAVLSNLLSNVLAVLVLRPLVSSVGNQPKTWLVIAMASTFAGNFTLPGSIANLIVAQCGQSRGLRIGFWDYFKVGAPLTVATIAVEIFGV